ncbi:hypothetical protein V1517DRAFT_322803 [Lipomyces orientalis]|uniref:Uncharacterized protein n=1 Tax=Lipomyces orientalis TaxID=1233043 RepID=A0ACC3TNE2_9ASCO
MSVISSYSESDNTGGMFKRRRQASCDDTDAGIGIASTVLSPAIHIVPPCHDGTRIMTSGESLRRKRRVRDDDGSSPYDSSDTLQEDDYDDDDDDDDDEMRDDATYVDYDDLGSDDEDENAVESVVDLSETGELMRAHAADEGHQKSHLVRLWQSFAGRNGEREGPNSPLRYLAGWTNEHRKRGHLAQKRRSVRASSSGSQAEDGFWTLNSKRRRSSTAESPVDIASSNNDYILPRNSHWPASTSASDIGDVQRSPRRYNTESGLPRYYPGGWPTPPEENDEDVAMDIENDGRDVLISSELALDARVMGPSVSEYSVLDGTDRPNVGCIAAATPVSDDEYDDDDEAEYFHDFGSLLQSLRDVANGCTSSVSSPSSSAGVLSPRRQQVIVIDCGDDKNSRDDDVNGAGVDYDYCNLALECDGTGMTVENDGFQIVVRDGPSLSSSPIEGCGVVARMPSSFSAH